jgi:hypothetical protein
MQKDNGTGKGATHPKPKPVPFVRIFNGENSKKYIKGNGAIWNLVIVRIFS